MAAYGCLVEPNVETVCACHWSCCYCHNTSLSPSNESLPAGHTPQTADDEKVASAIPNIDSRGMASRAHSVQWSFRCRWVCASFWRNFNVNDIFCVEINRVSLFCFEYFSEFYNGSCKTDDIVSEYGTGLKTGFFLLVWAVVSWTSAARNDKRNNNHNKLWGLYNDGN